MSVHLLVLFLLLVVLVPIFVLMAVAWKELQLRAAQTAGTRIERARGDLKRRMTPAQVSRFVNSMAPTSRAALFTPKRKRLRVSRGTASRPPVPAASGAHHPWVG